MQKHYFIGIKMPLHLEADVEAFRNKYRLRENYKVIPHLEDLHITLLYLGATADNHLTSLLRKLPEIAENHAPFSITIDGLSYFGSSSGPRVVYLSIKESSELKSLQREIEAELAKLCGLPISNRFVPHVTIAKKRKNKEKLVVEKEMIEPVEVPVQLFSLFTIHATKSPKYEAVEGFILPRHNKID